MIASRWVTNVSSNNFFRSKLCSVVLNDVGGEQCTCYGHNWFILVANWWGICVMLHTCRWLKLRRSFINSQKGINCWLQEGQTCCCPPQWVWRLWMDPQRRVCWVTVIQPPLKRPKLSSIWCFKTQFGAYGLKDVMKQRGSNPFLCTCYSNSTMSYSRMTIWNT